LHHQSTTGSVGKTSTKFKLFTNDFNYARHKMHGSRRQAATECTGQWASIESGPN